MPQRTNDFQRLVFAIYQKLAGTTAVVKESLLVPEINDPNEKSEVDILIEDTFAGSRIRCAVEVQKRTRKGGKTWMQQIATKYQDLDVQHIIAVAAEGFTKGAIKKARDKKIELLTLKDALETDWPSYFERFRLSRISTQFALHTVGFVLDPPMPDQVTLDHVIELAPDFRASVRDFAEIHYQHIVLPTVQRKFTEQFDGLFKTFADLKKYPVIEWALPFKRNTFIISRSGNRHAVKEIRVRILGRNTVQDGEVRRQMFKNVAVTTATIAHPVTNKPLEFKIVQSEKGKTTILLPELVAAQYRSLMQPSDLSPLQDSQGDGDTK